MTRTNKRSRRNHLALRGDVITQKNMLQRSLCSNSTERIIVEKLLRRVGREQKQLLMMRYRLELSDLQKVHTIHRKIGHEQTELHGVPFGEVTSIIRQVFNFRPIRRCWRSVHSNKKLADSTNNLTVLLKNFI